MSTRLTAESFAPESFISGPFASPLQRDERIAGVVLGSIALLIISCSSSTTPPKGRDSIERASSGGRSTRNTLEGTTAAPTGTLPQLQGEHRPVFILAHNRLLGHLVRRGGLVVPLGHPGLAKYTSFARPWRSWAPARDPKHGPIALAIRNVSWLVVPLTSRQSNASTLTLRIGTPIAQPLRLELNGKRLDDLPLGKGWQTLSVPIPPAALHTGENRIDLRWARSASFAGTSRVFGALHWLSLGGAEGGAAAAPDLRLMQDDALWLPGGGGLAYYVYPYRGAKLSITMRGVPDLSRCTLVSELDDGMESPQRVERRVTTPGLHKVSTMVDLAPVAERVTRVELRAEGEGCRGLLLDEAAIVLPGEPSAVQRARRPKNVLFWMVDNARADRYRGYESSSSVETPTIDRLIATGTLFEQSYIVGTESRVSHASIWTGLYPRQHGFIGPKARLSPALTTLAEAIRETPVYTAAWTANGNASKSWGFGEGWDFFRNTLHDGGGLDAKALTDHAITFVEKRGDKPFFLYLGTIDPHVSWRGRQPWLNRYFTGAYDGSYANIVWGKDWDRLASRPDTVSETDRRRIMAIYDSTISYNDEQLGRLLRVLDKKNLREDTLIVVTADHGEEFWEYGKIGHGGSLHESVVHVPLLIHYPPLFGEGVRVREGANVHALFATILDALGAPIPEMVQAASLLPLAQGEGRGYPRPSIATQYDLAYAMRLERYKLWIGGRGEPKLYDLSTHEKEREDRAASLPLATRWLTDALSLFLHYQDRWREARWGVASNHLPELPAELEQGGGPGLIQPLHH